MIEKLKNNYLISSLSLISIIIILLTPLIIFFLPYGKYYENIFLICFLSWLVSIKRYKFSINFILKINLILYPIIPFLIYFKFFILAEKIAILVFLNLILFIFQKLTQSNYQFSNKEEVSKKIVADFLKFLIETIDLSIKLKNFIIKKLKSKKDRQIILIILFSLFLIINLATFFLTNKFYQNYFIQNGFKFYFNRIIKIQLISSLILSVLILLTLIFKFNKTILAASFRSKTLKTKLYYFLFIFFFFLILSHLFIVKKDKKYLASNPIISYINPSESSFWQNVYIYGHNFGNAPYNGAHVSIEGIEHRILKWENTKIVIVVDPIRTKSGQLWVVNVDQKESNRINFKYLKL